ncbi:MAG: hypothetical protein H6Q62_285, partial [Firmicutes bacterium]|nr:hypothetical protein [Bacillota bacterium]
CRFSRRRGALGLLIIQAALVVFIVLPLGIALIGYVDSQMTLFRAGEFLDEVLPQASICLDPDAVANGGQPADPAAVERLIRLHLEATMPDVLRGRLSIESVAYACESGAIPVVSCTVEIRPFYGDQVVLTRSAELFLLPA